MDKKSEKKHGRLLNFFKKNAAPPCPENLSAALNQSEPGELAFKTDGEKGLSSEEVAIRVSEGRVNKNTDVKTKSVLQILRENLITFFNLVFVVLSVILCFVIDWHQGFLDVIGNFSFMILIIFNALIGIIQELRAKRTIDKLSLISAPKVTVLRDGEEVEIGVNDIVCDDITILSAGSQICADAEVIDGSIEVNESLITGEPDAILKTAGSKVMSGSFVIAGNAKAQVEHVGAENFANKISAGAKYFKKPNSEIWRSLMFVVKVMAIVIVPVGIALFCVKHFLQDVGVSVNETVIGTVTSVIGMIPSGLVALSSTVFCVSILRLSRRKILAQDLYCVETLARVDVICLDKTGTITEGSMEINDVVPIGEKSEDELKQTLADVINSLKDDNATANAIRSYVSELSPERTTENIIPFSSARKWSGAAFDGISYVLGAPEFVLKENADEITFKAAAPDADEKTTADGETLQNGERTVSEQVGEYAKQGFRVMVLASSKESFDGTSLPNNLSPECFILITDKIRKEAPDTLRFFKEEGVQVKIISGDNPETVRAVALRAGLEDCENIIDMSTLKTEEEINQAAEKYTIFGRVLPDQKLMLVNALKAAGHTVAMTGDGVNDVLALKSADCSIAMASGSDAAKNVSSLVLLDSNFSSMPHVVKEGRRSINNLERSAALYLMKTVYNTLLAILFMIVSHPLPLEPQNLTLIGGVTIGMPSIVLALEPNDDRVKGHFLPKVLANALPGGLTVLLGVIAVIIAHNYFLTDITNEQASTLFIAVITLSGFMLLAKVSLPFTWLHFGVYVLMIFCFVACYAVPLPADFFLTLFHLNTDFTWEMGKAFLCIAAVLIPIYVGLTFALHALHKKRYDFWEDKFGKLDDRMRVKLH